jgi:hypothetical protein
MTRRHPALIAAVAALIFGGPAFGRGQSPVRSIRIEEMLSIGGLDDEILFQWTGVAADGDGSIFVLDALDYSIKKFDASGRLLKKAGRKGQGPGEFMAPRLLDCSARFVYATDQNVFGILVFDKDLNYVKKIPCPSLIVYLKARGDDTVAVATLGIQNPGKILVLNGEGKILSERPVLDQVGPVLMMDSVCFVFDDEGNCYVAFLFQDRIEKRSPDGRRQWTKSLLGQKKIETSKVQSFTVPNDTCFKDMAWDARGHLFVLGGRLSKRPSRDIYVLNRSGVLVSTFALPDTSHCLHIDAAGCLYVRANDGVTLKKYRIIYE